MRTSYVRIIKENVSAIIIGILRHVLYHLVKYYDADTRIRTCTRARTFLILLRSNVCIVITMYRVTNDVIILYYNKVALYAHKYSYSPICASKINIGVGEQTSSAARFS
jgi:hypothetical protein